MKEQGKSYLVIIITLVIGIIIGAMTHRAAYRHYGGGGGCMHGCEKMRGPGPDMMEGPPKEKMKHHGSMIKKKMKYRLDPSDEQWGKMEPIIDAHMKKVFENMDEHKRVITEMKESLKKELAPILTPEQQEKLEEFGKHRGKFGGHRCKKGHGKHRGPWAK